MYYHYSTLQPVLLVLNSEIFLLSHSRFPLVVILSISLPTFLWLHLHLVLSLTARVPGFENLKQKFRFFSLCHTRDSHGFPQKFHQIWSNRYASYTKHIYKSED